LKQKNILVIYHSQGGTMEFMINVGINQASAVLGAPYGVFHHTA